MPGHRTKSCPVLGATATGLPGPFGTWTSDDEDAHADFALPAAQDNGEDS